MRLGILTSPGYISENVDSGEVESLEGREVEAEICVMGNFADMAESARFTLRV